MNTFGNRIRLLRNEKGMTGTELGELFDCSKSGVSSWETRGKEPSQEILKKLAEYFNVSLDYLLGVSDIRKEIVVSKETKGFAEKLVSQLIKENMINDPNNIPSEITDMIISALKMDIKNKKKD